MRRLMLALAVLLGASVAAAQADYFLIRINLGATKGGKAVQQQGGKGMPTMPGMGNPGNPGMGNPGNPGMGGGGMGPGGMGPGGPPPNMMNQMQQMMNKGGRGGTVKTQQAEEDDEDIYDPNSLHTDIVIEVTKHVFPRDRTGMFIPGTMKIWHKWGHSWITVNDTFIAIKQVKRRSVKDVFTHLPQYRQADKTADDWVQLARWALEHGLMKEVDSSMEKAKQLDANNQVVKTFDQVQDAMSRALAANDTVTFWQSKLPKFQVQNSAHYSLLYADGLKTDDVQTWSKQLEMNYRAFFDWFALQNKALQMPTSRLVAVLVNDRPDDPEMYHMLHDGLGIGQTENSDAFLARRNNLAVLSASPLDKAYVALNKSSESLWSSKGYDFDALLKAHGVKNASPEENEDAQMRALAIKAMRERSRVTDVSSEGTRQLAAAVGLLPREVKVPQWFEFGLGSFFETPHNAYWEGTGAASWTYLDLWKKWDQKDKLDKAEKALREVVTDAYFKLPRTKPEQALLKARTMSWALTYFLMERHPDGVFRFCEELNNLPRDMDLDPTLVMGCFSRAFHLGESDHPDQPTTARLIDFSAEWYKFLKDKPLPCPDLGKSLDDILTQKSGTNTNRPGGRPGMPGMPGMPGRGYPMLPGRGR
ncbi:MAG TPA: DUF1570 domain-containing protein [Gemmataceae bacterium]|nr:DUF1570 domain-containing protein [Gemmataceae bacterium]